MQKIFVAPELPITLRDALKCLTLFSQAELRLSSERLSSDYDSNSIAQEVLAWKADLVLTRNVKLARLLADEENHKKVILLSDCDVDCSTKILSNALIINSFMLSKSWIFKL